MDNSHPSAPSICSADLDGDGDIDVIGAARGTVNDLTWWENIDGSGNNWTEHTIPSSIQQISSVDTADINNDGYVDILCTDTGDEVVWMENVDGSGNNWTEHAIGYSNLPYDVYAADVDGDQDLDVIAPAYDGDYIRWWENTDGTGLNWYEHLIDDNFDGATDVAVADMDGDGDPDIIGAAHEDADIAWWDVTCCIRTSELVSSIIDTEANVQWDSITWNSTEPPETSIYFQVRSSNDPMYMGSWSTDITSPGSLESVLNNGDQYVQYKVILETTDPNFSPVLEDVTISWTELVGIDHENNLTNPAAFRLLSNHPNPFTTSTTIEYYLNIPQTVTITFYNQFGKQVDKTEQKQSVGIQRVVWTPENLADGIYYFRLEAGEHVASGKVVLARQPPYYVQKMSLPWPHNS
ncbi:MAG: T9SS type A sorting domain-containing protein [Bacteroidota bacterium]